jgi:phospholipase D1/2
LTTITANQSQWETIKLMYRLVADAIREKGIDAHPADYLNFYCLGNRCAPVCETSPKVLVFDII